MSRQLVMVHGRAQQGKDAAGVKQAWVDAWTDGLAKSGLSVPIGESAIHFPYYGDTLAELVQGGPAPDVVIMGHEPAPEEQEFIGTILEEARQARGITDDQVIAQAEGDIAEMGPQNWKWVRAIAKALDAHMPGASGATLATITSRAAIPSDEETVVVGHSLGTVVGSPDRLGVTHR